MSKDAKPGPGVHEFTKAMEHFKPPILSINGMPPEEWAMLARIESKLNRVLQILEMWNPADDSSA